MSPLPRWAMSEEIKSFNNIWKLSLMGQDSIKDSFIEIQWCVGLILHLFHKGVWFSKKERAKIFLMPSLVISPSALKLVHVVLGWLQPQEA